MSLPIFAEAVRRIPYITTWTRLEPLPREGSMQRSLQAQVRDPLWFLTRQWQVGEFLGDDAGSPVNATLSVEQRNLTTYRSNGPNGSNTASPTALDPGLPVEAHVERETVALRLRGAVQLGLYFEKLIRSSGLAGPDQVTVIAAFRSAFPLAAAPPDPALADRDGLRFRALAAGRVTDGEALYAAALAVAKGQPPPQPLPAQATDPQVAPMLADFLAYRQSLFSEPTGDASWQPQQLAYDFALGSPAPDRNVSLRADAFPGGHLDWYSFDLGDPGVTQEAPAAVTTADFKFLPNHVVFLGMPDPRWWNFEDSVTDFGQLDADHVDLAKLLVMEFALVYGNDWFTVPVPTPIGTLARVTTLEVTDTFGVRTLIRPAEATRVNAGESPWSMFKLSGPGSRSDFIVMAPTLGLAEDADALEEVLFLRDDMAAMAWAVEHKLQGDLDAPVDADEIAQRYLQSDPPPAATPGGPKVYYTLATPVPGNWIPMVPVRSPQGELFLRRGTVANPAVGSVPARAGILEPQHPFFVADRVVSRSGALVDRHFRRARGADGGTFVWLARKSTQGRGPGWSGLRFDVVRDL